MTENETKAVRFIENIKNHATVTLDHIVKEEPNVSPLVYKGREEKADTILKMIEELRQYRAIGTPEECRAWKEKPTAYDPDKVVEQLENERMFWENAYDRDLGKEKARSYEHAVEIVKGGGVE